MAEITKLDKHSQGTTRDKYKTIARAKAMSHGDLEDHITSHMLNCCDDDCDICDLGQSGSMIDDEEGEGSEHDYGSRSSEDRKGSDYIDTAGKEAEKDTKGDRENLMKHGQHIGKHAGPKHIPGTVSKASAKLLGARNAKGINLKHKGTPNFHI